MKVGTAMIAAHAEICFTTVFWRTLWSARFACRTLVRSSRWLITNSSTLRAWSATSRKKLRRRSSTCGNAPRSRSWSGSSNGDTARWNSITSLFSR